MATSRRKRLPVNATLVKRVQTMVDALEIKATDEGLVGLAFLLASTIDGMDDGMRQKMLGQTAGQLVNVLAALRNQATPKDSFGSRHRGGVGVGAMSRWAS